MKYPTPPHNWFKHNFYCILNDFEVELPMNSSFDKQVDELVNETIQEEQTMLYLFAGHLCKQGLIQELDYEYLENLITDFYNERYGK